MFMVGLVGLGIGWVRVVLNYFLWTIILYS